MIMKCHKNTHRAFALRNPEKLWNHDGRLDKPQTVVLLMMDPLVKGSGGEKSRTLIRVVILCIVAAAAVASRLFSVIRKSWATQSIL